MTHPQAMEFFVSRNMLCGNNSTIFFQKGNRSGRPKEITVTVPVVIQTQLCVLMVKGEGIWCKFRKISSITKAYSILIWYKDRSYFLTISCTEKWKNGKNASWCNTFTGVIASAVAKSLVLETASLN